MFNFFKRKKEKEKVKANYIGSDMTYGMTVINSGENIVIIDARTKEEYNLGHIKNSINIPLSEKENINEKLKDKTQKILVYADDIKTSSELSAYIALGGFTNVIDIGKFSEYIGEIEK